MKCIKLAYHFGGWGCGQVSELQETLEFLIGKKKKE